MPNMIRLPLVKTGQFALLICSIIFSVIPTVFIILRLIARRIAKRRLDAADYFIMGAWVCCLFFFSYLPCLVVLDQGLLIYSCYLTQLMTVGLAITIILEVFYGGFGWHRTEVIAKYGDDVITVYHIVSLFVCVSAVLKFGTATGSSRPGGY